MPSTAKTPASIPTLNDPRVKSKLQELRQADNVSNWIYLARTYLYFTVVIGAAVAFFTLNTASAWLNVPVAVLAIVLVGAGQHQLTALAHEASHHILFKNRLLNDFVSDWCCMFPMYSATQHYRLQHIAHHQFINDPDRDPDISQLKTSGHWLNFPVNRSTFLHMLWSQLWLPNLIRFIRIRAAYNAMPTDKNPYVKKGWKPNPWPVRIGIVYMLALIGVLTACVVQESPLLLAIVPNVILIGVLALMRSLPESAYHQSRVHPIISMRTMSLWRTIHVSIVYNSLAWLSLYVTPYAALYYVVLWLVPIFTSFSFFMILRQIVQHGNGGRGWLTNTRVFHVNPFLTFAVFPLGQDYHLPHHIFASVPHYRLKELHEFLTDVEEYRQQAVVVEGYFMPYEKDGVHPTVVDVLGPAYHVRPEELYIDNDVLDDEEVDDKEAILREGEEEKLKYRKTVSAQA